MPRWILLTGAASLMISCVDYDLSRPDDKELPAEDTAEPAVEEPAEDPDIQVVPVALDFGSWLKDCPTDPETITVTNKGLGTLEVDNIFLSGPGLTAFTHTGGPMTLEYNESAEFEVVFTPTAWVDYDVDLVLENNDPDEAPTIVSLIGTGAQGSTFEESFVQEYTDQVDVLWVVDNSCSMDDELVTMSSNFASFIQAFASLDVDYHIAVVTTDMDDPQDSGQFQGPWMDNKTPNLLGEFSDQVNQGTTGSGSEKGLAAVNAALSTPLVYSKLHSGFLRDEAALSVIIVTDENDDSGLNTNNFSTWFRGLKKDPELARFNAFCGDRFLGCQDPFNSGITATGGDRYIDVVDATGGFFASICTSNYSSALEELSFSSVGMNIDFPLSEEPQTLDGMTVTIDGTEWSQDADNGWSYDPDSNSITFHGEAIPGPDEEVTVTYTIEGECPNE